MSWESAEKLVHPARRAEAATPADIGIAHETLALVTADGVALSAWWMPAAGEPRGSVVFLHGYGDHKAQSLALAPFLHRAGYHVLALDFRAHGASGGDATTVGLEETKDVETALAWLRARPDADGRVALLGWSMGAATALNAAPDLSEVDAIVADSGFATLENIAGNSIQHFTGLPRTPFGPLSVTFAGWQAGRDVAENRPVERMRALDAPVLVIQGEADVIARADDDGRALFAAAPEGSELWLVPGARHVEAFALAPDAYEARVLAFLARHLG